MSQWGNPWQRQALLESLAGARTSQKRPLLDLQNVLRGERPKPWLSCQLIAFKAAELQQAFLVTGTQLKVVEDQSYFKYSTVLHDFRLRGNLRASC